MLSAPSVVIRAGARRAAPRVGAAAASVRTRRFALPSAFPTGAAVLSPPPLGNRVQDIVPPHLQSFITSTPSQQFAVIKVGGAILTEYLDDLCRTLKFLSNLGLYPVVVHGGGPQLNHLLAEAGVEPQFEEGIRVTDAKTLGVARKLFLEENLKLVNRLDQLGVATRSLHGVFIAEYLDKEKWQYVGKISRVNKESIEKSIEAGYVPILTSMAESEDGRLLNVNADVAAAELARSLNPAKVVYLSEKGGLFDGEGDRISNIDLHKEFDHLMSQPWCRYGNRLKLKEIKALLDNLPHTSSVAIIHPSELQNELFSNSGVGTVICRGGN